MDRGTDSHIVRAAFPSPPQLHGMQRMRTNSPKKCWMPVLLVLGMMCGGGMAVDAAEPLQFAGLQWRVRSTGEGGPGPNLWDEKHVWVDEQGALHLKLAPRDGRWASAEVSTVEKLGFGTYEFRIDGPIDQLDRNVVLGLFNYPPAAIGASGTHEIDIEFARWGHPKAPIGNYTVWPVAADVKQTTHSFEFKLNGTYTTHRFEWRKEKIAFESLHGHVDGKGMLFADWTFEPQDATQRISREPMPVHLNLWCFEGRPPTDGKPVEIVIRGFRYTP